jgi:uncharacterized protein YjiS (DUF1127 family)
VILSRFRVAFPRENDFPGVLEDCAMRDYVLNQAISQEEFGLVPFLRRVRRNWKAKRRIVALTSFDDYMLRDIGVTRDEVQWAAGLPLTVNAAIALEERAFRRRHVGPSE